MTALKEFKGGGSGVCQRMGIEHSGGRPPLGTAMTESKTSDLPTLQCNALRIILGKREFEPEEVAQLDYQLLNRSPRIGRKGIVYIRDWLRQFGYEIANFPATEPAKRNQRQEKQVTKAVNVLRRNGFDVQLEPLLGHSKALVCDKRR